MAWGSSGPAGEDLREEARRWLERMGVAARIRNRAFALQEVYLKKAGELGKKMPKSGIKKGAILRRLKKLVLS